MTLNSARSWQTTSLNSAKNDSLKYVAKSVRAPLQVSDCPARGMMLQKSHFEMCDKYRRVAYARACIGSNIALTRWQEWCVPYLPEIRIESAASIMLLVEIHIASFLNDNHAIRRALSRTAAGYSVGACNCFFEHQNYRHSNCAVVKNKHAPDLGLEETSNHCIHSKFPRKTLIKVKTNSSTPYKVKAQDIGKTAKLPTQEHETWRQSSAGASSNKQKLRQCMLHRGKPSSSKEGARKPADFVAASYIDGTHSSQVKTHNFIRDMPLKIGLSLQHTRSFGPAEISTSRLRLSQRMRYDNDFTSAAKKKEIVRVLCSHIGRKPVRLLRFQGGGADKMTCYICQTTGPAYIPRQLADEYVARCKTCGRGACNSHGKWELHCFHCAACDGNDDHVIACAKETLLLRCLSKAFQHQSLLYATDGALLDFTLTLALTNRKKPPDTNLDFDPQDFVAALCFSYLQDKGLVDKLFAQDWVSTWAVWKDIGPDATDVKFEAVAQNFMQIAFEQLPLNRKTDAERLRELQASGLQRWPAAHHGVNNCLIDAMLLTLAASNIVPGNMGRKHRRQLCAACRYHLWQNHGTPSRIYLDAHRDAPRILAFFLERTWNRPVAVCVHLYDRFDHGDLQLLHAHRVDSLDYTHPQCKGGKVHNVHIYNHTDASGNGYHFDALLPFKGETAEADPDLQQNACNGPIQHEQNPTNGHGDLFPGWAIYTRHLTGTVQSLLEALLQN